MAKGRTKIAGRGNKLGQSKSSLGSTGGGGAKKFKAKTSGRSPHR